MHIAYLTQYFPPEPAAPAARVSEMARAWARAGHRVTVLTGFPNYPSGIVPPEYRGRAFQREDWHGVEVHRSWIFAAPNKGRFPRMLNYLSFATSSSLAGLLALDCPDVLIATSPPVFAGIAGRLLGRLRRIPFVFEVRDLWPESISALGALAEGSLGIRALEAVAQDLYQGSAAVVVVTDAFREILLARGVPGAKLHVLKNGVDLTRFTPSGRQTPLRDRLGLGDQFVAAYVGTHGIAHGLGAVLDVAARMLSKRDVHFLFVGDGAERQSLADRVRRDGLTNVTILGSLPREHMAEVYATADACLVPLRRTELFTTVIPSKIFEIMAMARPIVLSVDGEARAIVEQSQGGIFVTPEDVDGMERAIGQLVSDRAAAQSMGARGREFVMRHFDRESLASDYLRVLEGVRFP